jgi:uncharacterized membrane protein
VAQASASAAIAGLLFVAISINVDRIIKMAWLAPRAAMTMIVLVGSVLEALIALWPRQSAIFLGSELLIVSVGVLLFVVRLSPAASKMPRELIRYHFQNMTLMQIAALPAIFGSACIFAGVDMGFYAVAFQWLWPWL